MNAKKNKNKKGIKQPNPNPPQKEETEMEKSQEKIESEISDRADLTSDIVVEESELPKKPKRNRGKKKKHDKEDEKGDEKTPERTTNTDEIAKSEIEANITEAKPKCADQIEDIQNNATEVPIKVEIETPASENTLKPEPFEPDGKHPKKKNKKKKQRHDSDRSDKSGDGVSCTSAFQKLLEGPDEKPTDTPEMESEDMHGTLPAADIIKDILLEEKNEPNKPSEVIQETILPIESEVPKQDMEEFKDMQKHENKKKKHKKDKKHPPKTEDISVSPSNEPPVVLPQIIDAIALGEIIPNQLTTPMDDKNVPVKDFTVVTPDDSNEQILGNTNKSEDAPVFSKTLSMQEPVFDKGTPEVLPQEILEPETLKSVAEMTKPDSESPKPKAKIAKPVDKKRKIKQDAADLLLTSPDTSQPPESIDLPKFSEEILSPIKDSPQKEDLETSDFDKLLEPTQPLITDIIDFRITPEKQVTNLEISPIQECLKPIEDTTPDICDTEVTKQEIHLTTSAPTSADKVLTPDIKDVPESEPVKVIQEPNINKDIQNKKDASPDNKTGKKKRKPLKMPIPPPVLSEPINTLEEMTIELGKEGKDEMGDVESIFETLVPTEIEVKATDEKLEEILELKVESVEDTVKSSPETTKGPEEKWTKPKRKGKKSIKMPPTPGIKDEPFSDLGAKLKDTEECSKETDISTAQSPTESLEIRSVKADDSECSPCDVTPDIVYPRSTSQHNIDNNNNTLIREITIPDTLNLSVGLTAPLIQGSGETPTGTPVMVSSFNITEVDSSAVKTDIKSKIVEVNKDMEEHRLSIERSLAELTSMEKSEEEVEKKYEEAHKDELKLNVTEGQNKEETQVTKKETPDTQTQSEPAFSSAANESMQKLAPLATQEDDKDLDKPKDITEKEPIKEESKKAPEKTQCAEPPPVIPSRRDNKGKGKKKKGKQEATQATTTQQQSTDSTKEKREEKTEQKTETKEQSKQDTKQKDSEDMPSNDDFNASEPITDVDYDPIENFEDALTSSGDTDDVNKSFEMILNQVTDSNQKELASKKPDINITAPEEDFREGNVPQPKNLLGQTDIPASSNKDDFKKEKHKMLNTKQAKVKIKDANDIEMKKESKQSQTENRKKSKDFSMVNSNENGDFIYKYSFRKVFLQNSCHVCAKELSSMRVPCNFCNLLFYCSIKHKDEDWPQHQALCFAISTIVHLKDQKHIYAEAMNITGQNYRLLRMQMILSCEKVLKRRLVPWEQEALLYPRICADIRCREWRQSKLKDCEGCGQISYCANELNHLPKSHQRWCKSYALYQKLVTHQQTKGRLEPKLPTKVMGGNYEIPEKINEVLASMYEEQIDNMNDVQYAALTQIATAPLTVAYGHQLCRKLAKPPTNGIFKKSSFVIHVLGAELQFEADVLNKWEVFFLHLRPDVSELVVVLISNNLNPGNLPLELLGKIRLCDNCREDKRRVIFSFQDKKTYQEYRTCDDFIFPDIVCAFNASINRSSYSAKDPWPGVITSVMRLRSPFLITSHTPTELHRDLIRVKECGEVKMLVDPRRNPFASVRPDRNFITDDETPLLFKNQCFMVLCGV